MSRKKQYVVPDRLHYDVFERYMAENGVVDISYVCSCASEFEAQRIALAKAAFHKNVRKVSFVVRARPTEAHNTFKAFTDEERQYQERYEGVRQEITTQQLADRIVAASVNGNGKPSPTVVKAVQKVLS